MCYVISCHTYPILSSLHTIIQSLSSIDRFKHSSNDNITSLQHHITTLTHEKQELLMKLDTKEEERGEIESQCNERYVMLMDIANE